MVDQVLTAILPILEEEHKACQQLIALMEIQRRCLTEGDAEGLREVVAQGRQVTLRLETAEQERLAVLQRYAHEEVDHVALSALVTQASEPLRSRGEALRQALCAAGLRLRVDIDTNMRLMEQSQQLTACLVSALAQTQRPDGYAPGGTAPTPNGVSVVVDSHV